MISLVLIVCLIASPDTCREERPPIDVISAFECVLQGQQIAHDWLEDHPKWTLSGWRCEPPRQPA